MCVVSVCMCSECAIVYLGGLDTAPLSCHRKTHETLYVLIFVLMYIHKNSCHVCTLQKYYSLYFLKGCAHHIPYSIYILASFESLLIILHEILVPNKIKYPITGVIPSFSRFRPYCVCVCVV